jgi:hypothetical protein
MLTPRRALVTLPLLAVLVGPALAMAEGSGAMSPVGQLRPVWSVERTDGGRARVVGYLYNENELQNAANVWLRVDQLTASGEVGKSYRGRVVGDVLSRGRMVFEVPVGDAATYRVLVESVDWVGECR